MSLTFVLGCLMAVLDLIGPNPSLPTIPSPGSHLLHPPAIWIHSESGRPPAPAGRAGRLLIPLCPSHPTPTLSAKPASSTWNPPCGHRPLPPMLPEAVLAHGSQSLNMAHPGSNPPMDAPREAIVLNGAQGLTQTCPFPKPSPPLPSLWPRRLPSSPEGRADSCLRAFALALPPALTALLQDMLRVFAQTSSFSSPSLFQHCPPSPSQARTAPPLLCFSVRKRSPSFSFFFLRRYF